MGETKLIRNIRILTMDKGKKKIEKGYILVEGNEITDVDRMARFKNPGSVDSVIEGKGKLAIPGLIDSHTHIAMCFLRGITSDLSNVLYNVYWPIEKAWTPEGIHAAALLGGSEALKFGVTTVVDHYFFMEKIAEALTKIGLRGVLGHTIMSVDGPWIGEKEFRRGVSFVEKWKGKSNLVIPCFAPHAPDTVYPEWLREIRDLAEEKDTLIHMHVHQTKREEDKVKGPWGGGARSPIDLLNKLGVLNSRLLAVHCTFIDKEDIELLVKGNATVVHCPSTYALNGLKYNSSELVRRGVPVIIGTDAPCTNDNIDLIEELRTLIMTQRTIYSSETVFPASQALEMVTSLAAERLGLSNSIGSIEKGKKADITIIDIKKSHLTPHFNEEASIVYSANGNDVDTVFVDGEIVVEEGKLTKMNETKIIEKADKEARNLISKALEMQPGLKEALPKSIINCF